VKKTPMAEFCPKVSLTTTGSAFCDAVEKRTRGATRVRPIMGANPKREPRRWQASSAECSFLHRKSRVGHRSHSLSFVDPVWQAGGNLSTLSGRIHIMPETHHPCVHRRFGTMSVSFFQKKEKLWSRLVLYSVDNCFQSVRL